MTVVGLGPLLANLNRIGAQIEAAAPAGLTAGAERIRDAWIHNIEEDGLVLTGHYRDSVHVERDGDVVGVLTDVDYAGVLEFGDSRIAAHPVAERAFDEHGEHALDDVADNVGAVIR